MKKNIKIILGIFLILIIGVFAYTEKIIYTSKSTGKAIDENGNQIVYNKDEYIKLWLKNKNLKVTVIDTCCISQTEKAKKDIRNGNFLYYTLVNKEFCELEKLLKKYNIKLKKGADCGGSQLGGFNSFCYQEEMSKKIFEKYGSKLFDSLEEVAQKNYVLKNPTIEYIEDGIDVRAKYLKKNQKLR
jgi:hypothetical protein